MKTIYPKLLLLLLAGQLLLAPVTYAKTPVEIANEDGYPMTENYNPKGTIVIAAKNGQVLYSDHPDVKWPPASMSKLMTLYLVYQAMDHGKINLNTKVTVNDKFYEISTLPMLSNNHFRKGATYTVDELLHIMLTASSNSATFMLSSLVHKDDSDFVDLMNKTASKLGMKNTHYYNPAGPPNNLLLQYKPARYQEDDDNISTARDYAILARHIVNEYPQVLNYTKLLTVTVKKGTIDEETFATYNHSLEGAQLSYKGVDGLKTGSSDTAGFNTTITGRRNGMRIIQVIMGVEDWYDPPAEFNRNKIANAIMDDVYSKYSYKKVLSKGYYKNGDQELYIHHDLYDVVKKGVTGKLIFKDGKATYQYARSFVSKDTEVPNVTYEDYQQYRIKKFIDDYFVQLTIGITLSILAGLLLLLYYYRNNIKKLFNKR
ncbi:DUF1958 domain-containing protein [Macrococcus equipercicus]|uniref:D-alanyl-D-alanine carboxypeptidase n=1 Tax=Macrococcus equipercicus TaxID=69967 RepID=A0A9Q9BTX9_9STAP|nr:DUF1958 domain-containing protein [Macrococcus equipercicus]UTH13971.1 D-alanyl-D-alanine carboxypeptidase [Macrococcus equipercicus]